MVGPSRPMPLDLKAGRGLFAGDPPPLSPNAVNRVVRAATDALAAIEGLARVTELPAPLAARILAEPAARLRRELIAAGVPLPAWENLP